MKFFAELQRRNVYKVAVAYAVVGWLLIQIATQVFPFFEVPNWAVRLVVLVILVGFPIALVIAWAFELTPEGIKRTEDVDATIGAAAKSHAWIYVALVAALLSLGLFFLGRFTASSLQDAVAADAPAKSIAVLPFENLSDDKQNAYFADGVQDEILTDLAKVADLKVISRTSVMQYRDAGTRNLRQIAQQLGVAHLLEGSVQRAGGRVRVNAQLIDARTDAHLWAQTYDRDLADVFAIQSEIAETIAEQLQAQLSPNERAAIAKAPTNDVVANDLYVRAQALDDLSNDPGAKDELLAAIDLLEEAVRRDPKFVLAQCLLSDVHLDLYWGGFDHTPARREQAHLALQRAEEINPESGEVHLQKGAYAYHGFREYETARAEFEIARRLLPNSAHLYLYMASLARRQARWADAVKNFDRAVELDPRNSFILEESALTRGGLRRYSEARTLFQRTLALNPTDYFAAAILWQLPFSEHAELKPLRTQLDALLARNRDAAAHFAQLFVECALAERDRKAAEAALALIPVEGTVDPRNDSLWPREWYVGLVARDFGDERGAQAAFAAARAVAAKTAQEQPDYAPAWEILGAIDAGLGDKADAVTEGKRAVELLPISKDAWDGPSLVTNLALIYAWVGEKDLALVQLADSAHMPAGVSYGELKLSPNWDALRNDPRFDRIIASLAPH
ncbi:MAG: FlgO family outer membrane protein [Chthoniobacterales bacterium]